MPPDALDQVIPADDPVAIAHQIDEKVEDLCVNAGEKMHRRAGVKMHHGRSRARDLNSAFLFDCAEPSFPSRPGDYQATARSVGDGRSAATRTPDLTRGSMASPGPSP